MPHITLASIQPPCLDEASPAAHAHMTERGFALLAEALAKDTAFCCLPEYFNVFGAEPAQYNALAANHADFLERTRALAANHAAHIVLPMIVPDNGAFYNRAYVIDPRGAIAGRYDKVHPTLGERAQLRIAAGSAPVAVDTEHGRIAVPICYDIYFPEFFSALARLKPDILFFPSLQRSDHETASEAMLRTRAMDAKAYIVRSSYGRAADLPWKAGQMFGQSAIVHPDGTFLANAGHYEGIALAHVEVPFVWQRQRCGGYPAEPVRDFLAEDRRPEAYGA
ncbi:MAG: carbon-nitrogen hydrolase family protein [Candidatus Latescibacteria bacterium]|jgi:predicted amidohydrolase|nr:carbon-nitrogen hydrolase family protein [Candidatus Latescibacterota bacterium]